MNNFLNFGSWLFEKKKSRNLEYGCVMLYASDISEWNKQISFIEPEDVYDNDNNDYGIEKEPHITVLYGIHINETDPNSVKEVIKTFEPLEITSTDKISIFKNPWNDYDVVKFDIEHNTKLNNYNTILKHAFPYTTDFPKYHPHMTIAYVKKGIGKQYIDKIKPFTIFFNKAIYSYKESPKDKNRKKIIINL